MIDNSKNKKLKFVYEDKNKNKWYTFKNPMDIGAIRGIAAQKAERYVAMMVTKDELKLALDAHREAAKKGDIEKCFAIIYDLRYRTEMLCEENSVLDLAHIYYFLKDEDPEDESDYYRQQKQEIWAKDTACRSFFLRLGLALTKTFSPTSEKDLLKYLSQTKEVAQRLSRHIPQFNPK